MQLERRIARGLEVSGGERSLGQLRPGGVPPGDADEGLEPRRIRRLTGEGGHRQRADRLLPLALAGQRSGAGEHLQHLLVAPQALQRDGPRPEDCADHLRAAGVRRELDGRGEVDDFLVSTLSQELR
ncbi:MAG: hypothetical protein E6J84_15285 [Deltaproteobacteria bacterium]|nr:MAG: hypothetical protein E6J84_15285 [Deltaproteobacteria bacterium]